MSGTRRDERECRCRIPYCRWWLILRDATRFAVSVPASLVVMDSIGAWSWPPIYKRPIEAALPIVIKNMMNIIEFFATTERTTLILREYGAFQITMNAAKFMVGLSVCVGAGAYLGFIELVLSQFAVLTYLWQSNFMHAVVFMPSSCILYGINNLFFSFIISPLQLAKLGEQSLNVLQKTYKIFVSNPLRSLLIISIAYRGMNEYGLFTFATKPTFFAFTFLINKCLKFSDYLVSIPKPFYNLVPKERWHYVSGNSALYLETGLKKYEEKFAPNKKEMIYAMGRVAAKESVIGILELSAMCVFYYGVSLLNLDDVANGNYQLQILLVSTYFALVFGSLISKLVDEYDVVQRVTTCFSSLFYRKLTPSHSVEMEMMDVEVDMRAGI